MNGYWLLPEKDEPLAQSMLKGIVTGCIVGLLGSLLVAAIIRIF